MCGEKDREIRRDLTHRRAVPPRHERVWQKTPITIFIEHCPTSTASAFTAYFVRPGDFRRSLLSPPSRWSLGSL
jgi:hypothetical protein